MQVAKREGTVFDERFPGLADERAAILIVDDLPEKLLVFRTVLEDLGQELVQVQSGAAALREILKREFAVILLDVNMPDIDGFETATLIRKHPRSMHTPIIFVTSYADELQTARGYSLGAVDYILSPVVPEMLRSKVGVFVSLYLMNRQIRRQADSRAAILAAEAARRVAEENDRRSAFLAKASRVLNGSLQVDDAARQCAELLASELGTLGLVQLVDADLGPREFVVAAAAGTRLHIERGRETVLDPLLRELLCEVLESRKGKVVHDRAVRELGPGAFGLDSKLPWTVPGFAVATPMCFGDRVLGAVLVLAPGSDGAWEPAVLAALLEETSARAASAFENARLFRVLQHEVLERMAAQEALQASNQRKDEFLAMMSHELRNPLAPIHMAVEVVRRTAAPNPKVNWALDIATRQLRQLTRLIEELLDVSRISQGKFALKRERIDLRQVIAQSLETVHGLCDSHRQKVTVELPPDAVWVHGDFARLTQVIANLLHNASKYSPDETSIALQCRVEKNVAVVSVRDQGMGIDAELLPRIFELFAQGKRGLDRSQGGLGVGLTLARRLALMHGGDIDVFSEGHDKGSVFTVRLPAAPAPVVEVIAVESSARPASWRRLERVLVVDDNRDAAEVVAAILQLDGHEVRVASDGEQALVVAVEFQPAVAIVDIGLPLIDGYEVARRLRTLPAGEGLLLIALTGYGQHDDRRAALEAGFDHHFVKPADPTLLLACIHEWQGLRDNPAASAAPGREGLRHE